MKKCTNCGILKPIEEFYKRNKNTDKRVSYCKKCWSLSRSKSVEKRYIDNRKKKLPFSYAMIRYNRQRLKVIKHYGGECACCGIGDYEFLAIDHKYGDGAEDRKKFPNIIQFVAWIVRNNYPKKYRILCHNCNASYGHFGYCPHNLGPDDCETLKEYRTGKITEKECKEMGLSIKLLKKYGVKYLFGTII